MSDFLDQVQLLFTTSWKPFLLCLATVVAATWFITNKFYDRELSTLKTERDGARTELSNSKGKFAREIPSALKDISGAGPGVASDDKLVVVSGRSYSNERVVLDGMHFERCDFSNVTLVYNGGRFTFTNNTVKGFQVASDNPQIANSWKFLFDIGFIKFDGRNEFGPVKPSNPVPTVGPN